MGFWTRQVLLNRGYSDAKISRAARSGEIERLVPGLFVSPGAGIQEKIAALAHKYQRYAVSGKAAILLDTPKIAEYARWRARAASEDFYLPVTFRAPKSTAQTQNEYVQIKRTSRLRARKRNGVRLATPAQAAADALELEGADELLIRQYLAEAYRSLRGREAFARDVSQVRSSRRTEIMDIARRAPVGTASRWEQRVINELRHAGLDPIPNFKLGSYYWDIGFKRGSTVIDLDSLKYHAPTTGNLDTFLIGAWKMNQAAQLGWATLRFTDLCTEYHMKWVKKVVTDTVRHRAEKKGIRVRPEPAEGYLPWAAWEFHEGISFGARD